MPLSTINNFEYATVNFPVKKMASAKTVWIDTNAYISTLTANPNLDEENLYNFFQKTFAYGIYGNERFDEINFDLSDEKTLKAERYGGAGIGDNAGGVRCGNLGSFQIKGIGKNCLVGSGKDSWHSYGGLNMEEAICEAINSVILDRILPVGVVKSYGLICTGENTAYPPSDEPGRPKTGLGALLIRDACLRPAHFYRSNFYRNKSGSKNRIHHDVFRTRQVNIQLKTQLKDNIELIKFIGIFLKNCANQFAFSRAFGIVHGAISPSNISFDGKWIDLSTATFVQNPENDNCFFAEAADILVIVEEFLYNHGKYTLQDFKIGPLANYYWGQYDAHLNLYIAEAFGFPKEICEKVVASEFFNEISIYFVDFPSKTEDSKKIKTSIQRNKVSAALFAEKIFRESAEILLNKSKEQSEFLKFITNNLVKNDYSKISFIIQNIIICCLRKFYFTDIFSINEIRDSVRKHLTSMKTNNIQELIGEYGITSQWLFGRLDSDDECVLLNSKSIKIIFNNKNGYFQVLDRDENKNFIFDAAKSLSNFISKIEHRKLKVNGQLAIEHIIKIIDVLAEYDEIKAFNSDL